MKRYDDSLTLLLHLLSAAAVDDYIAKMIYRCFHLLEKKNDAWMMIGRYGDAKAAAPHYRFDHLESHD